MWRRITTCITKKSIKKTENSFVIGPFQEYLEFIANEDSYIDLDLYDIKDLDIDSYPDIEPSYHLLEENYEQLVIEECDEKSYQDDKYYKSFFV